MDTPATEVSRVQPAPLSQSNIQPQSVYPSTNVRLVNSVPSVCPMCHIQVRLTDYFCYNCGKNLHPKPLSTSIEIQILYYVGSLVLPPMGFIWGFRYIREN